MDGSSKLVDHEQQPRRQRADPGPARGDRNPATGPRGRAGAGLPGGERRTRPDRPPEPRRTRRTRPPSPRPPPAAPTSSSGARVGVKSPGIATTPTPARPASPSARTRGSAPARSGDALARARAPPTPPAAPRPPGAVDVRLQRLGRGRFAAEEERRRPVPRTRPAPGIGGTGHRSRPTAPRRRRPPGPAPAGTLPRAAATNSSASRPGQAQRARPSSADGLLVCGAVDAPLQSLTDRGDTPAAAASSSWVGFALGHRSRRSGPGRGRRRTARSPSSRPRATCPTRLPAPGGTSCLPTVRRPPVAPAVLLPPRSACVPRVRAPRPGPTGSSRLSYKERPAGRAPTPGSRRRSQACGFLWAVLWAVLSGGLCRGEHLRRPRQWSQPRPQPCRAHFSFRYQAGSPAKPPRRHDAPESSDTRWRTPRRPAQHQVWQPPVGPAPGQADLAHRRQLEKSVSWSGRERLPVPVVPAPPGRQRR